MTSLSGRRPFTLGVAALLLTAILALVAFLPLGWTREMVERRFSEDLGRQITIGSINRDSNLSFTPVVRVEDITISQAEWAGSGNLASIRQLRLSVPILPLLIGRLEPRILIADGVRLDLVRTADGRVNWRGKDDDRSGRKLDLTKIERGNGLIRYRDAKQRRQFTVNFSITPNSGVQANGRGLVDGNPVRIAANGPAFAAGQEWPFNAALEGEALSMTMKGTMTSPLRTDRMRFHVKARASDLKLIDYVIEAGLFQTQPVRIAAEVQREPGLWKIRRLTGTIGSSEIDGNLDVAKVEGRTKLSGKVHSPKLDFDDLASDAGNAAALALEKSQGVKIVPNVRVNIRKIGNTDGRIAFRVDQIESRRRPSSLTGASGVLTLDHRLLTISPLNIRLAEGKLSGQATVDQSRGQPEPTVTLSLDLRSNSIRALAGGVDGEVDGRVDGKVRLTGIGSTVREAVGRSNGRVGFIASGELPAKLAALLGFDVGALIMDSGKRANLRCAALGLDIKGGQGTVSPLLVDTSLSQSQGGGTIRFPGENIAISVSGVPKGDVTLHLPGAVVLGGTLRDPSVKVPPKVKSAGNVIRAIGRAIGGHEVVRPNDVDCGRLRRAILG